VNRAGVPADVGPAEIADRLTGSLLWRAVRCHYALVALLAGATMASTAAMLALPAALADAVDGALQGHAAAALPLLAVLAVTTAADPLTQFADGRCRAAITAWLREQLVRHVLSFGMQGSRRFAQGDLLERLTGNAPAAAGAIPVTVSAVTQSMAAAGAIVLLGLITPLLLAVLAVGIALGTVLARSFARDVRVFVLGYQETLAVIAARLVDALAGIRTIRASGTCDREIERVTHPLPRLGEFGRRMWRRNARAVWRASLLVSAALLAVLAVAGRQVASGQLPPGELLAAAGYVVLAFGFLGNAQAQYALAQARTSARRLAEVLAVRPMDSGCGALPQGPGELEFRQVTLSMPDGRGRSRLLDRVDLSVPAGRSVAVVGRSGAGKSMLAALAGRLIDPDAGQVLLDGQPLPAIDTKLLRRAVAYASQQSALFGATMADAIGPGPPEALQAAARVAHAHAFISRLPAGYQTLLAEAPMSGGEAQRLGLARAIAHGGRLVILDDAAAGLDTVTERQVSLALAEAMPGRTRLIVTHRIATAARADLVAWLDDGRIRAVARHAELWSDPAYRDLFGSAAPGNRTPELGENGRTAP
jgi:ATP-binding cassette subfamily B protein